ncbi:MAG: hypothetical protein HY706_20200 [Candidatus Hydrogenedentes bacterium]|nr:hypothetical protein [Candidatus Hydrogenedentota bacterium]
MKVAVSIPDKLFKTAECATRQLGISRSTLYQRALAEFLAQHEERAVTEALNAVYGPGGQDSRLDPVLEELQISSIPKEQW